MVAVFKADTEEQNKAATLCAVGSSLGIPNLISLLLSIWKLNVSCFYVLMISDLMTKVLEHLTFEGWLTYEERAGIV